MTTYQNFWTLLEDFQRTGDKSAIKASHEQFKNDFYAIAQTMDPVMFGPLVDPEECGESIFNNDEFGIGGDDGHIDLCHTIIWHGAQAVSDFMRDPTTAIPIARKSRLDTTYKGYDLMMSLIDEDDDE